MTPTDRTARAAAALGLSPGADGAAARAAFLRTLAGEGFVPAEEAVAAVNALAGTALPLTPDAEAAEAELFRQEVETFASEYWSLNPDDRRARWTDLSARRPDAREATYLQHLGRGLDVPTTPHPDPEVEEAAALVRELFVLRLRPRAIRRAEWLANRANGETSWRTAIRRMRSEAPATALLDPELIDRLEVPSPAPGSIPAVEGKRKDVRDLYQPVTADTPGGYYQREDGQWVHTGTYHGGYSVSERRQREESGSVPGWGALLLVIVGGLLLRGCFGVVQHAPRSVPPSYQPTYTLPTAKRWPDENRTFTRQELESFLRHDPKSGQPPPPGYDEWRRQTGGSLDGLQNSKKLFGPEDLGKLLKDYEKHKRIEPYLPQTRPTSRR